MTRLAFYTFGLLREPGGHPTVQGFADRVQPTLDASRAAPGYVIGVSGQLDEVFAPWQSPPYIDPALDLLVASTVSVWEDLESVFAFAYGGLHGEALRGRREWFVPTEWPTYCAWWVVDGHIPHYPEAVERAAHYHAHGPTPTAFDFRTAFDADGNPMQLDRVRAAALRKPIDG